MRKPNKLCPVCRSAYYRLEFGDGGSLYYIHYDGTVAGERMVIACQVTRHSNIRGVKMDTAPQAK